MKKKKSNLQKRKDNPGSKYWRNKADPLWSEVIRRLYPVCAICGATPIDPHHLISRSNGATRHSIENGMGLCQNCHIFDHKLSAHGAPLAFAEYLQVNYPEKWEWCCKNKNIVCKPDYEGAYYRLRKDLNDEE